MSDIKSRAINTYCKPIPQTGTIDVYRVLLAFGVTDPCLQHAIKKLLCPGKRAAGKSADQDVKEALYSIQRYLEMRQEEDREGLLAAGVEFIDEAKPEAARVMCRFCHHPGHGSICRMGGSEGQCYCSASVGPQP